MKHLFRAKDEYGNTVYGDVVYGSPYITYHEDGSQDYAYVFVDELNYSERWEVVFDEDGYADDEYYPNWDVGTIDIDWNTLEFNLNGKWIKYEVNNEG